MPTLSISGFPDSAGVEGSQSFLTICPTSRVERSITIGRHHVLLGLLVAFEASLGSWLGSFCDSVLSDLPSQRGTAVTLDLQVCLPSITLVS